VDKGGHGKTVPGSFALVSKVDSGKDGHVKTRKNKGLAPLSGTTVFHKHMFWLV
jgi:hypothetical protein